MNRKKKQGMTQLEHQMGRNRERVTQRVNFIIHLILSSFALMFCVRPDRAFFYAFGYHCVQPLLNKGDSHC